MPKKWAYFYIRQRRPRSWWYPNAHLWDNGKDPVTELKNVMKVRAKALSQFGENNIRKGTPMAMLKMYWFPFIYFIATK
jgi:hypothetical protein